MHAALWFMHATSWLMHSPSREVYAARKRRFEVLDVQLQSLVSFFYSSQSLSGSCAATCGPFLILSCHSWSPPSVVLSLGSNRDSTQTL
jgi:hypothetical protein